MNTVIYNRRFGTYEVRDVMTLELIFVSDNKVKAAQVAASGAGAEAVETVLAMINAA